MSAGASSFHRGRMHSVLGMCVQGTSAAKRATSLSGVGFTGEHASGDEPLGEGWFRALICGSVTVTREPDELSLVLQAVGVCCGWPNGAWPQKGHQDASRSANWRSVV